ncbi:uncharacterized protein F4817DRAFT_367119 [Daldinia loculata]|uniref:uncharacterized protein n=1 Tax=Daldinia loculata TaxID=103429 RepID=UPI0020C288EF|nr:uncharacterized protein F4817DRAFT_367119 [Daldinia loculata]KAI1645103.1 hypothetical protein F4817DRAFT_367119 [Daldinia loculata]
MELSSPADHSNDWHTGGFVIGIDMGPTYFVASYSFHNDGIPSAQVAPSVICKWPGPLHCCMADIKTPSKISYDANGGISWGLHIEGKQHVISWFELLLVDDNDLQPTFRDLDYIQESRRIIGVLGKNPIEMVGDFLGKVFEHIVMCIGQEKGEDFVNGKPFHVVITVPAFLGGIQLDRMKEAIGLSEILSARPNRVLKTTYKFVTEPEAATVTIAPELNRCDILIPGDSFIVVNLGGGTTDCISYVVDDTERFELREVVEGDGAIGGAVLLYQSFRMAIKKKIMDEECRS